MRPRFKPDDGSVPLSEPARLIDPEAFDASEQRFAASLEEKAEPLRSHFVVEEEPESPADSSANEVGESRVDSRVARGATEPTEKPAQEDPAEIAIAAPPLREDSPINLDSAEDANSWRQEVAARVNRYRSRREPRTPRYPSLQLKFDTSEEWSGGNSPADPVKAAPVVVVGQAAALVVPEPPPPALASLVPPKAVAAGPIATETGAKILEFPRPMPPPPVFLDELAEPVFVQPRILDVPDVLPPPPALGGILIEPGEETPAEHRRGFDLPLQAAPLWRRMLAGAIDGGFVVAAFALFAYSFFRITLVVPALKEALPVSAGLIAVFWTAYQYLLLVYTGTTPGLRLAKLQLCRFDGSPAARNIRRWRVLASAMSALSLMLGYAWCFLDEDELCWHDRITHTYLAPKMPQ